jgi:putative endonuclease
MLMEQYVYIARCADGTHYVGCTNNLKNRLLKHNRKQVQSTKYRTPLELVTHITFTDKYKAYAFEKYLKSGSGRAFLNKRLI